MVTTSRATAGGKEVTKQRELAYASIIDKMLAREFVPGQFLSQRQLVESTGLPLGPIREIIPRLESEGLLTALPQRGIQIAHVDLNLIREAFQFRLVMEKEAVQLFTRNASDAVIKSLRAEHEEMLTLAQSRILTSEEEEAAQQIDWKMHNTFIDAMGNNIISTAYRVNSVKTRLINQERYTIEGRVAPVMQEHLRIIDAIETRDPDKAIEALSEHINNSKALALNV
ncbi:MULTISPECIES: GntR family transcriptional regulator [Brucella/Ochrobactrum group]|jgi:DNA-binding GntR family transcriptional regulator|uniref:GntR family transcriptional regulator n=1 Tax=Brucella/Ochrobactrum group TaxID=2826938 RepID=UPI001C04BE21|nr:GntR family transcriptional regulator [Brucella sp. NBRC 12950]QWK81045.1 GntR family transcriptional regulator [Ochrobactrum sp. BTU1]GLU27482.1 GntR family transcriptional regulator [Brucella sp. NBRC 12950]